MKKVTKPSDLFSGAKLRVCRKGNMPPHWFNEFKYLLHTGVSVAEYRWTFTHQYMREGEPENGDFSLSDFEWYVLNPKDHEIFSDEEYEELWI